MFPCAQVLGEAEAQRREVTFPGPRGGSGEGLQQDVATGVGAGTTRLFQAF